MTYWMVHQMDILQWYHPFMSARRPQAGYLYFPLYDSNIQVVPDTLFSAAFTAHVLNTPHLHVLSCLTINAGSSYFTLRLHHQSSSVDSEILFKLIQETTKFRYFTIASTPVSARRMSLPFQHADMTSMQDKWWFAREDVFFYRWVIPEKWCLLFGQLRTGTIDVAVGRGLTCCRMSPSRPAVVYLSTISDSRTASMAYLGVFDSDWISHAFAKR